MRALLSQINLEIEERDFFRDPFARKELECLFRKHSPSAFFSWQSPSFRKLNCKKAELEEPRLLDLMVADPRLIKRPLIQIDDELIVGTNKSDITRPFG